jgi:integrase
VPSIGRLALQVRLSSPIGPSKAVPQLFAHLRGKLKVTDGHLHMFRHTFATRQLQAGVPVTVVSKILGHGSFSTTFNIYVHVLAELMEQFERQRARILSTYREPDAGAVAQERQVA